MTARVPIYRLDWWMVCFVLAFFLVIFPASAFSTTCDPEPGSYNETTLISCSSSGLNAFQIAHNSLSAIWSRSGSASPAITYTVLQGIDNGFTFETYPEFTGTAYIALPFGDGYNNWECLVDTFALEGESHDFWGACSGNTYVGPYTFAAYVPPPSNDFTCSPTSGISPLSVDCINSDNGTISSYYWELVNDNTIIGTSSTANYSFVLNTLGHTSVNRKITSATTTIWKNETDLLYVQSEYATPHLAVDIKDSFNSYILNANLGIFDGSDWYNVTCPSGACGFIHAGAGGADTLLIGNQYTIAAWKEDYTPASLVVNFTVDYQTETLTLAHEYGNETVTHLDLDVKDAVRSSYVEDSQIGLYRNSTDTWTNRTCQNGACGWANQVLSETYVIVAEHPDYLPASQVIQFSYDHQLFTLSMQPKASASVNQTLHLDVDIKDGLTNSYVTYADYGIYDYTLSEWQNGTCVNGACGFTTTGASHLTPVSLYKTYKLSASKTGYLTVTQDVVLSSDHQIFTLRLFPTGNATSANMSALPSYVVPTFPTVTGTIAINGSFDINSTVAFLNVTIPSSLPPIPTFLNSSYIHNDLVQKLPQISYLLAFIDGLMSYIFFIQLFFATLFLGPFMYVFSANTSVTSLLVGYLSSWTVMAAPIVWVIGVVANALGPKIIGVIIIAQCFDIILQIRDTVARD